MRCIKFFIIFNFLLISVYGFSGETNTSVTNSKSTTSEKKKKVRLDTLTVTGTGNKRLLSRTPILTHIIKKDNIINKGAFNLYDALKGAPGVRVEQQCSFCNFSQVRIQGAASGNTKILINGLPLFTGLAGVYGLQQYLSGNIERIEIIKGAGSSLYGGDAVAGVINVILADPSKASDLKITSFFQTHGSSMFNLVTSKRFQNWAVIATVQKSYEGQIDDNNDGVTDRVNLDNFAGTLNLFWYNPFGFFDRINFFGGAINEMRKGGVLTGNAWHNPFAEGTEHIRTRRLEGGVSFLKTIGKNKLTIKTAYSTYERDATNDTAQDDVFSQLTTISNASQLPAPFLANEELYFADARYSLNLGTFLKQCITFGGQYRRSNFEQEIGQLTQRAKTIKYANDTGFFLQDEITLSKKFDIVAGVRYDIHSSQEKYTNATMDFNKNYFSPRLALRYAPIQRLIMRASIGTGFRLPYHFMEDLHLCSGSPKVYKPAGLKPESSVTVNAGVQYNLTTSVLLGLSYTLINIKDRIDFGEGSVPTGYNYTWANVGDAVSHGLDINLKWRISAALDIDLGFSLVDARYSANPYESYDADTWGESTIGAVQAQANHNTFKERGKYLLRTPKTSGTLTVNYKPGDFAFYMNILFTGPMYITYSPDDEYLREILKTPVFAVANLRTSWKASRTMTLFAGVKNLFNFVQEDKRTDDAAFIWGPYTGREIYGGASLSL